MVIKPTLHKLSEIFGQEGALSQSIQGFKPRESQEKMAEAIEKALKLKASLIIEAGTGTGKTFGYLIPIFMAKKKTIISTGTKNLQDQLYFKDLPIIKKLFELPNKIVLLKGRANYLCLYHLNNSVESGLFMSPQEVTQLHLIHEWSNQTQSGDIAELTNIPDEAGIWSHVTSTVDNCLNSDCEFYKKCFVFKARQAALEADIVVVNHHLFFADLSLQEAGHGELLPGVEVVIFDEAHHLPDIATQFFSARLSSRQIIDLVRDSIALGTKDAKDVPAIVAVASDLQASVHRLRSEFGIELKRAPWPAPLNPKLQSSIDAVRADLALLEGTLKQFAERSKGLENCWKRASQLLEQFAKHTGTAPAETIHWFETYPHSFAIHLTPLIVAQQFKSYLQQHKGSWIFTSATLTVKNSFQMFIHALGLEQTIQLQLSSPFDFENQSMLYVPRHLPDPNAGHYPDALLTAIIPILHAAKGRTFILFTSHKTLMYVSEQLKKAVEYPLLVQGTLSKRQLIDQFVDLKNAVLCGTSSFWYGVDVRGDALSCVIIDKLPFTSPDDPILQARVKMLRQQGMNPFLQYQLPNAVLMLKQGFGRLIRDAADRGILVICDPRIVGARYGETFLQSLPYMPRTRNFDKVTAFFNTI